MAVLFLHLDCVSGPCPFGDVHLYPPGLPRLNRIFIWDVKASTKAGLELKFSAPLRQIQPGEMCPDLVSYNINSCIDKATVNIGTFCRNGSVSRVKLLGGVIMSLHLPWNLTVATSGFNIANRSSIKRKHGAVYCPLFSSPSNSLLEKVVVVSFCSVAIPLLGSKCLSLIVQCNNYANCCAAAFGAISLNFLKLKHNSFLALCETRQHN